MFKLLDVSDHLKQDQDSFLLFQFRCHIFGIGVWTHHLEHFLEKKMLFFEEFKQKKWTKQKPSTGPTSTAVQ